MAEQSLHREGEMKQEGKRELRWPGNSLSLSLLLHNQRPFRADDTRQRASDDTRSEQVLKESGTKVELRESGQDLLDPIITNRDPCEKGIFLYRHTHTNMHT